MIALEWKEGAGLSWAGGTLAARVRGDGDVRWLPDERTLELRGTLGARRARARGDDPTLELSLVHPLRSPAHVWVPHLTPAEGFVAGDAVFRAPAVLVADDAIALAFVPDLDDVRDAGASGWRAWLDYDHPRRTITLAAGAYRAEGHVFYVRERPEARGQRARLRLHVLASDRAEDLRNPYGMVARWLWERWGRPNLPASSSRASLSPMLAHIVRWAFASAWTESVWQDVGVVSVPGTTEPRSVGAPVFIVDVHRHPSVPRERRTWREPRSLWNQAWFSTQRCANGLLRHARRLDSPELERRARSMTEVALLAPQDDGLFPSVLRADEARGARRAEHAEELGRAGGAAPDGEASGTWHWTNSDRRPRAASERACHLVDAAFTCRMLLEWDKLAPGDARVLERVARFADRLVRLQRPSGAFPGWVEPDGAVPIELAEGPESAVSAALLLDLADRARTDGTTDVQRAAWRRAGLAALPLLEAIAQDGRWEDFETYWSCAPWGQERTGHRVERNGVYKQNTLSIAWCAEAFLAAWRTTNEPRLLDLARRSVDELSLYQAVWDPPWLPAPAHGGFGVMNADSEWNDARQSLFAPLYLELGAVTGDRELTERGISALRASFSMLYCPENASLARAYEARFPFFGPETYGFMMENQGHGGADPIGTFTIFTWGNGSALASAAKIADEHPELRAACGLE